MSQKQKNKGGKTDFKKCIPETIRIAKLKIWAKKNGKDKILEAFNDLKNNKNE
jgi:hypothetical protein